MRDKETLGEAVFKNSFRFIKMIIVVISGLWNLFTESTLKRGEKTLTNS